MPRFGGFDVLVIDPRPDQISAPRGRPFAKGNSGRKRGSKNRTTLLGAALLQDRQSDLLRTAIELACGGNVPMLKFLLGCSLPRERLITIDLPAIETADDAIEAYDRIIEAVTTGQNHPE
jgi:hypothetical protein